MLMSVSKLQQLQIKHLPMKARILRVYITQAKETYIHAVRICGSSNLVAILWKVQKSKSPDRVLDIHKH